jgi:hypothetical protein
VRLTSDEERRLDEFQRARGISSRSEAIRTLLAEARTAATPPTTELPPTRLRELEILVEEGYYSSTQAALESALEAGVRDLVRTHHDGIETLRRHARSSRSEKDDRRRADREGRELLRR